MRNSFIKKIRKFFFDDEDESEDSDESPSPGPDYEIESVIGSGAFGVIYKVLSNNQCYAVKTVNQKNNHFSQLEKEKSVQSELALHRRLKHRHIIAFKGELFNEIGYFMEYAPFGDLQTYIEVIKNPLSWFGQGRAFTYQIASALAYLKKNHVLHLDVKPKNLLLTDLATIKLCDFGLSYQLQNSDDSVESFHGTLRYDAPEAIQEGIRSFASDAYSFGSTIYFMLSGRAPYSWMRKMGAIRTAIVSGNTPEVSLFEEEPRQLLQSLWRREPNERVKIEEVVATLHK